MTDQEFTGIIQIKDTFQANLSSAVSEKEYNQMTHIIFVLEAFIRERKRDVLKRIVGR